MRRVIRLGDRTSHGGVVVSATSHFTIMDKPVARLGDRCTCPKKGHNNCVIVEGDPDWTIDGIPIALEGHMLSCGGVLISSMPNAGRAEDAGGTASQGISSANLSSAGALALSASGVADQNQSEYNQHFLLINDQTTSTALMEEKSQRFYEDAEKKKLSADDTKKAMLDKINELGPSNVSHHVVSDDGGICVFDVAPSSIASAEAKKRYVKETKAHAIVGKFYEPPADPAYHLEVMN